MGQQKYRVKREATDGYEGAKLHSSLASFRPRDSGSPSSTGSQSRLQTKLAGRRHVHAHTHHGANHAGQEEKQKKPN